MSQSALLQDLVKHALNEMGIPAPSTLMHVLALREGRLVAEKFHYEEGYAIWMVDSDVVEFYGREGKLLKTVAIALAEKGEAA
jgi:hypothetical protein